MTPYTLVDIFERFEERAASIFRVEESVLPTRFLQIGLRDPSQKTLFLQVSVLRTLTATIRVFLKTSYACSIISVSLPLSRSRSLSLSLSRVADIGAPWFCSRCCNGDFSCRSSIQWCTYTISVCLQHKRSDCHLSKIDVPQNWEISILFSFYSIRTALRKEQNKHSSHDILS
jgi:hypothetical protein